MANLKPRREQKIKIDHKSLQKHNQDKEMAEYLHEIRLKEAKHNERVMQDRTIMQFRLDVYKLALEKMLLVVEGPHDDVIASASHVAKTAVSELYNRVEEEAEATVERLKELQAEQDAQTAETTEEQPAENA